MRLPVLLKDGALTEEMLSMAREIVDSQREGELSGRSGTRALQSRQTAPGGASRSCSDDDDGPTMPADPAGEPSQQTR